MDNLSKVIAAVGMLGVFTAQAAHPIKPYAQQYIEETKIWIDEQGINCDQAEFAHEMCETVKVYFDEGTFEKERTKENQTILVMDYGMDLQTVLRYRSRIVAAYKYDPLQQKFVSDNPSVSISKLGRKILSEVDGFTYFNTQTQKSEPGFLPAAWLSELAGKYLGVAKHDKYDHATGSAHFSHGTKVFGYLAQHNPDAQFVIIDTQSFSPFIDHKEALCSKNTNDFYKKMNRAASSLLNDVIKSNQVEYINYSGGFERGDVYQAWATNGCSGSLSNRKAGQYIDSLKIVYQQLFETDGVLGIHAGAYKANHAENPLDTTRYDSRIRVMSYTTGAQDTNLSVFGVDGWRDVYDAHKSEFDGDQHIDMYVNFGYGRSSFWEQNSTPKMSSDVFGMRYRSDWEFPSASWAAPIATSYAIAVQAQLEATGEVTSFDPIYLKNKLLPANCYDFWRQFSLNGDGTCRIQDPLKYRLDELNLQSYLSN